MKKIFPLMTSLLLAIVAEAQTLNVQVGNVTYQFPASQTGDMTYADGTTLTIMGKTFDISDISKMMVDNTEVTDNLVQIAYNGTSATVTVAGNVAQFVEPTISGAYVSIEQSNTDAVDNDEITYQLSGTTTDGQFALSGSYKCTVALAGVSLTCATDAAINITNKKRIQLSVKNGTENTLTDCASGSQKGCVYSKGQLQLQGKGTLTVVGNTAHAIKSADYITVKNLTLNITGSVSDGINCNGYFQMKSGTVTMTGIGDDGIQCDLDGTTSTGETADHEDEDSGNVYLEGGTLTVTVSAAASKGVKAEGDLKVSDGTVNITTTGNGAYDSDENDAKGSACLKADGNMEISGGTLTLKSTGTGGKGIKADGTLTISGGTISATASGSQYKYSNSATASPKAIKSDGMLTISGGNITASSSYHEGIESKNTFYVTGGYVYSTAADDALNSTSDMYLKGGYIFARSTGTSTGADGIDANGNMYIQGATVYSIAHGEPDVAFDANSEGNKKVYVESGTIVAISGIESGASLTQSCYQTSYNKGTWYGLYSNDTLALAFQVPSSGTMGSTMVVSTAGATTLKSGITVSSGTKLWDGYGYIDATVSDGSSVSLSSYTGGNGGGGGFGPGGDGGGPGGQPGGGGFGPGGH
jgi:hypothetical protein